MNLSTRPLGEAFGKEVLDLDLSQLTEEQFAALYKLFQEEPLVLVRRQTLMESELANFSSRFGELDDGADIMLVLESFGKTVANSNRRGVVNYISNLRGQNGKPIGGLSNAELDWHTDQIHVPRVPTAAIFLALVTPDDGPRTSWCNTQLAYDALPEYLKATLENCRGLSKLGVTQTTNPLTVTIGRLRHIPAVGHPMVLKHPVTRAKCLYFCPSKTYAIEGVPYWEARVLLRELTEHCTRPEFIVTHSWRPGDLIMWDNARVWHQRDSYGSNLARFAMRTTVFLRPDHFPVPPEAEFMYW
jgi:alpha-ketoglutarate-dependent taurine dioxygenase